MRVLWLKLTAKLGTLLFRLKLRLQFWVLAPVESWINWRRAMAGRTLRELRAWATESNPAWRAICRHEAGRSARAFFRGRWAREDEP